MTRAIAIALILSCLAGAAWAGPVGAETIRLGGTGGPLEAMRLAGEAFHKTHPQANVAIVPGLGSRGGIKALQAGAVDVAVSATPAPAAEPGLMWVELARTPITSSSRSRPPSCSRRSCSLSARNPNRPQARASWTRRGRTGAGSGFLSRRTTSSTSCS